MTTLRIKSDRLGEVQEIVGYLQIIEEAYNNIYAFDLIVSEAKTRYAESRDSNWRYSGKRSRSRGLRRIRRVNDVILPEDRLRLKSVVIQSPGFWEFVGSLNPLEVIRKYLCDRHERIKDRDYRNKLEAEKMALEIEKLKTEVVADRINLLRNMGIPEDRINETITNHVVRPLSKIDAKQDGGLVGNAELLEKDNSTKGMKEKD